MRFFITGGTGFVGRALVARLLANGHQVAAWVRDRDAAREVLGPAVELVPTADGDLALSRALATTDLVINLAGAAIADRRWTRARRRLLRESRVDLTRRLVDAMASAHHRPKALLSASAIGYYGDRGNERLIESSPRGEGFLPELCADWEHEASRAKELGVRVAVFRLGLVLGEGGGVLGKLEPLFRKGLGGPLGHGRQHQSWIHLADLVRLFEHAARDASYRGVYNAVAPMQVSQRELADELAATLGRKARLPAPRLALRLVLGARAQLLLASQKVYPLRLQSRGFDFAFPRLRDALEDLVGRDRFAFNDVRAGAGPREPERGAHLAEMRAGPAH